VLEQTFRAVKRDCYAGLDSVTLRRRVAERVAGVIPFDSYGFGTTDPDTGVLSHMVAQMPADLALAYIDRLYPYEAARHAIDAARRGRVVYETREESREIVDVLRANGYRSGTHVIFGDRGLLWGKWCLLAQRASPDTLRKGRDLLRRLAPHVTHALRRAALIDHALTATERAAVAGVVILDARGRALLRTPGVEGMFDDLADVGLRYPDAIPLAVLRTVARLHESAQLPKDAAGAPDVATLRAQGQSGKWYVLQASLAEADSAAGAAAVVVVRLAIPRELAVMLTDLYGLSPREREVVSAVARGLTNKEIAARLGLSAHTVKEHLDRASAKTGARGRKALVARLFFDTYMPTLLAARPAGIAPRRVPRTATPI
jgi:DNA-binding CsgD family transcriptional regulator